MFYRCSSLISLENLKNWNTQNVVDIRNIFTDCNSLAVTSCNTNKNVVSGFISNKIANKTFSQAHKVKTTGKKSFQ